jgi:hypothetical protein
MIGICLSYDENHQIMHQVLKKFFDIWPDYPIRFRVPYNKTRPDNFDDIGIEPDFIQTPKPVKDTIDHLTKDLDGDEWVFFLLDDKLVVLLGF